MAASPKHTSTHQMCDCKQPGTIHSLSAWSPASPSLLQSELSLCSHTQRSDLIPYSSRSSYIYTVLKLHSAIWRQPRGWCGENGWTPMPYSIHSSAGPPWFQSICHSKVTSPTNRFILIFRKILILSPWQNLLFQCLKRLRSTDFEFLQLCKS